MALPPETMLELFAGGAALGLGVRLAVPSIRTVAYVEREAYAAAALVARMEDETLDSAPIWDDVSTFDGVAFRGIVDCVAGGFPCQDISVAGNGDGLDGERSGLWRELARVVREVEPRFVFVENSPALTFRGLGRVLSDLSAMGFDAEWGVFRASDVGAPHERARIFILAHATGARLQGGAGGGLCRAGRAPVVSSGGGGPMADAAGDRRKGVAIGNGLHVPPRGERGGQSPGVRAGAYPPGPEELRAWGDIHESAPHLEPAVCRMADGLAGRVERLRLIGNGVVPDVAALAWAELWRRAHA